VVARRRRTLRATHRQRQVRRSTRTAWQVRNTPASNRKTRAIRPACRSTTQLACIKTT